MKILSIIGSPRSNGNTYKTVRQIEQRMIQKDNTFEFEYIQLSKVHLETCKGCYLCIANGEENCPLKDDRVDIERRIKQADAVIFSSPVYTYNVSWIMKNFLDRFAYRCHRPDFHGKKAMVVISTGAVGLGFVGLLLSFMISAMGFTTCAKVGMTHAPAHEIDDNKIKKETRKLNKQVNRFYSKITSEEIMKPSLLKVFIFKKQQKAFSKAPQDSADFKFWKGKGWLEKETNYFYNVHIGNIKKLLAFLIP